MRAAAVRFDPALGRAERNRAATVDAVLAAAAGGARLIVLPELATSGYCFADAAEARAAAEPIPGPATAAWQRAAERTGAVVVAGICELDERGQLRNSAVVVDASGVRAAYRKLHLWGREAQVFVAGDEPAPVVETAAGRIGVEVCYDLWFPDVAADLAARGAEIIAVPSNLSAAPGPGPLEVDASCPPLPHVDIVVAVATAHVNRVHLVLADRCGEERGERWLGAAVIVDAHGNLVAGPPPGDGPAAATAELALDAARDKAWGPHNDLRADRRDDVLRAR